MIPISWMRKFIREIPFMDRAVQCEHRAIALSDFGAAVHDSGIAGERGHERTSLIGGLEINLEA